MVKVQMKEDFSRHVILSRRVVIFGILFFKADMQEERRFMQLAIKLALQGKGRVYPNPLVGAVVVLNGKIAGRGYHPYFGGEHAEIAALKEAGGNCKEAVLFVNLEPCTHFGKRPPCVVEIIKAGIKKVFIGMLDPNPINTGRGVEALKKAGIETFVGIEEEKARKLNKDFINYIEKQKQNK